jgi:DNA (cytosine-5)-methyltransferase 1
MMLYGNYTIGYMKEVEINHLDLFSGIGGFHLGFERAGFKINSYFSEIDKYAIQVYKDKFKDSNYVGSVTDVRGGDLPDIDLITFGSPCQDFSLAGKRKGLGGERSSLISEAIRLIREKRPRVFVWENVKGTFSSNNRQDFAAILQAFANIGGYRLEWQLLNTKWFLPQNRERIYLVGYIGDGSGGQIFPVGESSKQTNELPRQQGNTCTLTTRYGADGNGSYIIERKLDAQEVEVGTLRTHKDGKGFREIKDGDCPTIPARAREDGSGQPIVKINSATSKGYEVAKEGDSINYSVPTSKTRRGRVGKGVAQTLDTACNQAVMESTKIRRLTPIECERLQGFPDDWTKQGTEGMISDTQRYKMCGNAVTVDVVAAVAERIKRVVYA